MINKGHKHRVNLAPIKSQLCCHQSATVSQVKITSSDTET